MDDFVFDPRLFILPPFQTCPDCGREESYGVLMINGTPYRRRCRECWHSLEYELPEIRKTVIYLDQMAISNMTKILQQRQIDPFWLELFERLDVLSKLQLVICPDSQTHREESALVPYAGALRDVYELLSHGTSFEFTQQILESQLFAYLENWLGGHAERELDLDIERVTNGAVHKWQERFRIRVGGLDGEDWVERLRESRDRGSAGMAAIHERWRELGQNFDFEAVYRRELRGFGSGTIEQRVRSIQQQARMLHGEEEFDVEAMFPSNASALVLGIQHYLRESGVAEDDPWIKTAEFFASDTLDQVPYLRISCLLFAAIARKAATGGQTQPPDRGTLNDVKTVASVLPYCDAIFVDNYVAGLLGEVPLRSRISYGTQVFAQNRRDEFLVYLDELRAAASDDHVELVREVYGEGYLRPYTSILDSQGGDD